MTHGSLFSGIGGFDLAAQWADIPTIWQVEKEKYARKVLAKNFPEAKRMEDIFDVKGQDLEPVDIISGGFPCQPFSHAGKRGGSKDDRYLWPEMFRIIQEVKPSWIIAENVPGFLSIEDGMAFEKTIADLEAGGYEVWTFQIPAVSVNAQHIRDRVWIIANHSGKSYRENKTRTDQRQKHEFRKSAFNQDVSDTDKKRLSRRAISGSVDKIGAKPAKQTDGFDKLDGWTYWKFEPDVERMVHGLSNRVDRIKGLGNAIVPQVAYQIFEAIKDYEKYTEYQDDSR